MEPLDVDAAVGLLGGGPGGGPGGGAPLIFLLEPLQSTMKLW